MIWLLKLNFNALVRCLIHKIKIKCKVQEMPKPM